MPAEDPLSSFIGNLAKQIQVAKDHKHIMEAVYASASATETVKEQQDPFASFLNKIGNTISAKLPAKKPVISAEQVVVDQIIIQEISPVIAQSAPSTTMETDQPVRDLAQKIKDAIEKAKFKAQHPETVEQEEVTSIPTVSATEEPADKQIASYIDELEKIKDTGTVKQQKEAKTTLEELKEYIDKAVYDYSRRILDLGGGGGSVAVQYANGGTMNGDLNVNGNYLSGGVNLLDIFSGGGGGSGDPAVNALVHANSGQWNEAYSNLVSNSAAYLSGYDISFIIAASGNWESTYTTVSNNSGYWSDAYSNLVANSANYLSGFDVGFITSNFVHLSGDTMTGNLSSTALIYSRSVLPQLPTPKIVLGQQADTGYFTTIQYLTGGYDGHSPYGRNANFYIASDLLRIYNHPLLIVKDITEEMLSTYQIFIEMVIFKKRKNRPNGTGYQKRGMSFRTPVGNDGDKPWTGVFWTRSGGIGNAFADGGLIRYNQLPVSYNRQTIDLTPCLNGHFAAKPVAYRDQTSVDPFDFKYLNCIVPFGGRGTGSSNPVGSQYRFGYSSRYQPLYIAFRYIAWLPENNNGRGQIVDGPLSPTIRVTNTHFPFFPNSYASSAKGFAVVDANPNFINYYNKHFICKF